MICENCGNEMEEGEVFCKGCGRPVERTVNTSVANASYSNTAFNSVTQRGIMVNPGIIKLGIAVVALLMALATLLPYMNLNSTLASFTGVKSISLVYASGTIGDGVFFIALAVATIIFLRRQQDIMVLFCSIASFFLYCYEMAHLQKWDKDWGDALGSLLKIDDIVTKGIGFYLLGFSVIVLLVLNICLFLVERKDKRRI